MKKFARILVYFLVGIIILLLISMFLSPKKLRVEVEQSIQAPANICFTLVEDLSRWTLWSPWAELDGNIVYAYSANTSEVGARMHWKGNEAVGEGWQTMTARRKADSIQYSLEFKGWDGLAYTNMYFQELNDKTMVRWTFDGSNTPFPLRPLNLIGKSELKKSLEKGLINLKRLAEDRANQKIYRGFQIKETELTSKNYILNRKTVALENIQQFYTQNLGSLFAKIQSEGLSLDGMPSGLFYSYGVQLGKTDMAAAIPIQEDLDIRGVNTVSLEPGRVVQVDYHGDYTGLENAHKAIDEYLTDYGLEYAFPVVEEYMTDPGEEPDPSKWLTRITYYLIHE